MLSHTIRSTPPLATWPTALHHRATCVTPATLTLTPVSSAPSCPPLRCFYTELPRLVKGPGLSPAQLTALNLDKSALLAKLAGQRYGGRLEGLLAELQFAFVAFVYGQSLDGEPAGLQVVQVLHACMPARRCRDAVLSGSAACMRRCLRAWLPGCRAACVPVRLCACGCVACLSTELPVWLPPDVELPGSSCAQQQAAGMPQRLPGRHDPLPALPPPAGFRQWKALLQLWLGCEEAPLSSHQQEYVLLLRAVRAQLQQGLGAGQAGMSPLGVPLVEELLPDSFLRHGFVSLLGLLQECQEQVGPELWAEVSGPEGVEGGVIVQAGLPAACWLAAVRAVKRYGTVEPPCTSLAADVPLTIDTATCTLH